MNKAKVYIIIVHFNDVEDTLLCIKSLLPQTDYFEKIIVVNNTGIEFIENSDSLLFTDEIININTNENRGYSAACNFGINYAKNLFDVDYYWLLNNDVEVDLSCLKNLLICSENNSGVGLWGSKIFHLNNKKILQGIAGKYNKFLCTTKHIDQGQFENNESGASNLKFDYPLGVSLFIKNEFIKDVGLLSEDYFIYFEELDYAQRAKSSKWLIGICMKSKIYHKGGSSIGAIKENRKAKSALSDFHAIRSRIIITRKYFPLYLPFLYLFFGILIFDMIYREKIKRVKMIFQLLANVNTPFIESRYL